MELLIKAINYEQVFHLSYSAFRM